MAIEYNWKCTVCGAANVAGTAKCSQCGSSAIISPIEISLGRTGGDRPRLSTSERFTLFAWTGIFGVGAFLEAMSIPPKAIWFIGMGLMVLCFVVLLTVGAVWKRK
jgi:hypothetical protein